MKSVFAVVPGSDIVQDTIAPGGGFNAGFIPFWIMGIDTLKLLPDLRSIVTGTFDWKWLADRFRAPSPSSTRCCALFTLDINNIPPDVNALIDPTKPFRQAIIGHPERIHAPTFVVGGWHDLFTNRNRTSSTRLTYPAARRSC